MANFDPIIKRQAYLRDDRAMLRFYLETKYDPERPMGMFDYAATWLKIVYWHHDPSLTPLQTILKAYENMPDVPRPDFVSAAA